MKSVPLFIVTTLLLSACSAGIVHMEKGDIQTDASRWQTDFFDDFNSFDTDNWQDQILWVNQEDQCYVRNNLFNTREVSNGTLKLQVIDLGEKRVCDNIDKTGKQHPDTQYLAGRIASKNRK